MKAFFSFLLLIISGLAPFSLAMAGERTAENPHRYASIDVVISDLYRSLSQKERDWQLFRSLFATDARIVIKGDLPGRLASGQQLTVEQYIRTNSRFMAESAFSEREIARREEIFGSIAQIMSTCRTENTYKGLRFVQNGINAIQLIKENGRWYIQSIVFDVESPEQPIPLRYLSK